MTCWPIAIGPFIHNTKHLELNQAAQQTTTLLPGVFVVRKVVVQLQGHSIRNRFTFTATDWESQNDNGAK